METSVTATPREFVFERPTRARTNVELALRRFSRQKLAMAGLAIVAVLTFLAIFAPVVAPTGYDEADLMSANQFPSWDHPFGTDPIGHEYLSRVIFGIRTSFTVGLLAVAVACGLGIPLGLLAGLRGGAADFVVLRIVEVWTAFPNILFAMFLLSVINSGVLSGVFSDRVRNVALVIGFTSWVGLCRLTRAQILTLREHEYVSAARSIGASDFQIAVRHLLPNAIPPLIIAVTLLMPAAIFAEAGLSFLGLAINEPTPSLGKMVADSRQYLQLYWYLAVFPTVAIALAVLGFAFVGDGLRDALDPRQN
ncbi:MAG TPA: ABC transporter permease [Thermomicrobiales bacterium]|nr:ABC transporter permease [Thermomicrobiales bacterium]